MLLARAGTGRAGGASQCLTRGTSAGCTAFAVNAGGAGGVAVTAGGRTSPFGDGTGIIRAASANPAASASAAPAHCRRVTVLVPVLTSTRGGNGRGHFTCSGSPGIST